VCSGLRGVPRFKIFAILFDVRRLVERQVLLCTTVQVARALTAMSRDVFAISCTLRHQFSPRFGSFRGPWFFSGKTCLRVA